MRNTQNKWDIWTEKRDDAQAVWATGNEDILTEIEGATDCNGYEKEKVGIVPCMRKEGNNQKISEQLPKWRWMESP